MTILRGCVQKYCLLLGALCVLSTSLQGQVAPQLIEKVDDTNRVTLTGNVHPMARAEFDHGAVSSGQPMKRILLLLKQSAEQEGLHKIFQEAGFEWRESGCSMCLGMNPDILQPGERCASTSNRNFEGRQGRGGRTHLVSPMMAAAAAIAGHFTDIRNWQYH